LCHCCNERYVSYRHNVFRDSWYWLTYNWLMFVTVKIIWNRSCKKKWNTRFIHSALGVSGYWEVSRHASNFSRGWISNFLIIHFACGHFSVTLFEYIFWLVIWNGNFLLWHIKFIFFIFTFCLWALYFITMHWNKCLLQLWNSWTTCQCLGSRFEM